MLYQIEVWDKEFDVWDSWCTTRYLDYAIEIAKAMIKSKGHANIRIKETGYGEKSHIIEGKDITLNI